MRQYLPVEGLSNPRMTLVVFGPENLHKMFTEGPGKGIPCGAVFCTVGVIGVWQLLNTCQTRQYWITLYGIVMQHGAVQYEKSSAPINDTLIVCSKLHVDRCRHVPVW